MQFREKKREGEMITAEICEYKELPKGIQEEMEGDEYSSYLVIREDGRVLKVRCDSMAPEDATFYRDLNWIPEEINKAYKKGVVVGTLDACETILNTGNVESIKVLKEIRSMISISNKLLKDMEDKK